MSASAVEAKSLSSLTTLAFNPPAYPRNPTHVKHEPLTLYIARVPGSKDVFLSPMKPREKVVTAEDIQSSLYFVHVENPEDARLLVPLDYQSSAYPGQGQAFPTRSAATSIRRKAVPGTSSGPPTTTLARKPILGTLAPVNNFANQQNVNAGNHSSRLHSLAPDHTSRRSFDSARHQQENERPTVSPRRASENPARIGTILTLIRRDPVSGAQWNVARIEDPNIFEVSSLASTDTRRKIGAPMYIEILNPGYSKFLHSDATNSHTPLSTQNSDLSLHSLRNLPSQHYVTIPGNHTSPAVNENVFRRRLWMEGTQHSSVGFGHRKKTSQDYDGPRPNSRGTYGKPKELAADTPSFLQHQDQTFGTIQVSDRQTSFRGYVFNSPWNGRCEFVTGVGGGSLKCRHIVPGLQGAPPGAMTVSELRFNLPSSSNIATPRGEDSSKRLSLFKRGRHSRNSSSITLSHDDGSEDARSSLDRLDLSLGQEFAGGGFGGKQAKLGKIILEDEGLKMMDLLMAANIGLWWRAYERASISSKGDHGSSQDHLTA